MCSGFRSIETVLLHNFRGIVQTVRPGRHRERFPSEDQILNRCARVEEGLVRTFHHVGGAIFSQHIPRILIDPIVFLILSYPPSSKGRSKKLIFLISLFFIYLGVIIWSILWSIEGYQTYLVNPLFAIMAFICVFGLIMLSSSAIYFLYKNDRFIEKYTGSLDNSTIRNN